MSREKQIDEISKLICTYPQCTNYNVIGGCKIADCQNVDTAEHLYNAGYRKQSEVIDEFVKRFEKHIGNCTFTLGQANDIQYALKKAMEEMEGGEQMNIHDATEIAYKNGYAKGFADAKADWISVTERLPDPDHPVLMFTRKNSYYVGGYYKAVVDPKYTGFYADSVKRDVTHWMPLPEPPEMKGGE